MKIIKVIELNDRIVFCDDIIGIYIENNYCPVRYQLVTKNGTHKINDKDYETIKEYLLSLNNEVEILEEKKIPEKLPKSVTDNACSSKDMRLIAITINQLIDYFKSRGDE